MCTIRIQLFSCYESYVSVYTRLFWQFIMIIHQQNFVNLIIMNKSMLVSTYIYGDALLAAGDSGKTE